MKSNDKEPKKGSKFSDLFGFKKPEWMKNVTRRMVIIWAVSFLGFLVFGFGTVAIVMVAIPKNYGISINYDNVFMVEYKNEKHTKQLFLKEDSLHAEPMKDILKRLSNGGKTNALTNLFRGADSQVIETNNTNTIYTSTFENTYAQNAIIIRFQTPQHSLESISRTEYKLASAEANATRRIFEIMIPLDNVDNRFQSQTWYLITSDPNKSSSGSSMSISTKISTYGNYSKLWAYVNDLDVKL
ncbi:MAG: hypothetical protein LBG88_04185 [Christensenellaceae bacterium]|jgi:hypothetical protein|nr:hypothetical protein [Christensenellaceae bacterium]